MLAATTIGIVRVRNLFAVAILTGVYSFLMASVLVVLDAVDVAMTEASVGAGVSTVLILGALHLTKTEEARPVHGMLLPLHVAGRTAAVLFWGVRATPPFCAADTIILERRPDLMRRAQPGTSISNVVSSVLASYRGFDTLGETAVIFTAGIAVLMLLKRRTRDGGER